MLDFGWILVGFAKTPRRLFKVEILTSDFQRWTNVRFSTLDQPYTYFVTDVMAVTDVIKIIFFDGNFLCFFLSFETLVGFWLDLGCPYYNLKSTKIQRWNCVRFST